jgi:transcriptional regulator with XRE-family HTH domain
MSKRSNEKRITPASRALRFLREQAKLSYRQAQKASGVNMAIINHLENGRIAIHQRHLDKLLPTYGATMRTFEMFSSGGVVVPQNLRHECISLVRDMSLDQLRTAFPVLVSVSSQK